MSLPTHVVVILVVALVTHNSTFAQPVPRDFPNMEPLPDYQERVERLARSHICGYRVKSTLKMWDPGKYDKKVSLDIPRDYVFGDSVWVERSVSRLKAGGVIVDCSWANRDEVYAMEEAKAGSFKLTLHYVEWEKPTNYVNSFSHYLPVKSMVHKLYPSDKFVSQERAEFEGRAAIKLNYFDTHEIPKTVYLDRDTYQFLHSEQPRSHDYASNSVKNQKLVTHTTYREAGGKRLPTLVERYKVTASGEKLPQQVIEFHEYAPYTPKADELDLEKRFGIKPIPLPPRPESAGRRTVGRSKWWYAAGGALALVAIGLLLAARRRKPT